MYDVGIIGSGPAGMAAALYLLRAGKSVIMFEGEAIGGQLAKSPHIENYPGFDGPGFELANRMFNQISECENFRFEFDHVEEVAKTEDGFKIIGAETFDTRYVIYAAGVSHKTLPCIKDEMDHVHYCATCDGAFYKGQDVAVIGDGNTALQYALELARYCRSVFIITMFNKFFGERILIDQVKKNPKITWHPGISITKVEQNEDEEDITLSDNDEYNLNVDGVFIAIGQKVNRIKMPPEVWTVNGFITTRSNYCSMLDNFYAVGDCREKEVRQVTLATAEGTTAALDIIRKENENGR